MTRVDPFGLVVVRVRPDVLLVAILAVKSGVALPTIVHTDPVVDLDVGLEVAKAGKRLSTDFALVAMLESIVLFELVGGGEYLEAVGAATVFGEGVGLVDVNFELSEEGKREVALTALVWLSSHVTLQRKNNVICHCIIHSLPARYSVVLIILSYMHILGMATTIL